MVFWELRQKQPVIDFRMLKDRNFALATLTMLVLGFVLYGSTALLPLFLQTLLGYTAMLSGLVLSPGRHRGLRAACRWWACCCAKYQARWLVIFGVLVSAAGLFAMSRFNLRRRLPHRGLEPHRAERRAGVSVRAHQRRGLRLHPQGAHQLRHRSLQPGAQYRRQLRHRHRHHPAGAPRAVPPAVLVAHLTPYDAAYRRCLGRPPQLLQARGASLPDAAAQAQGLIYGKLLRQSSMLAFADAFWVMGSAVSG